ncbi:MAG: hypothetical protein AAGD28_27275, partial [Bacteroidota bacterium]
MKSFLYTVLCLSLLLGLGQLAFPQNQILASGGVQTGSGGSVSFSLGQLAYNVQNGTSFNLTQGLQQPMEISVFPVEFLYFKAEQFENRKGQVKLSWATASEINNDFFSLERSSEGAIWESIASLKGIGNSQETVSYAIWDEQALLGQ